MDDDWEDDPQRAAGERRPRTVWGAVVVGALITGVSLAAIWWVEGFDSICPAIYPAPPSCSADARERAAIIWSAVVVAVFAVVVAAAIWAQRGHRSLVRAGLAALIAAGVIGYSATLGSSGFIVSG